MSSDVQEPRFIPGYDPEDPSADLRARGAKNKAQTVVGNVQRSLSDVSGVWPDGSFDSGGSERAPHATVWDAFTTAPGIGGDLNYFDLERHNYQYSGQRSGGQFSAFLQERLNGAPKAFLEQADAKSLRELGFTTPKRGAEVSRSAHAYDSTNQDALLTLSASPETEAHNEWGAIGGVDGGTQSDTTRAVVAADQDDDPVIEYDALYGADDGSHLVLDTVTNAFFRPVDLYGEPPELVEFPGEDGSVYTYVAVRKSMVEARVQRQQAWFDAQEQLQLQQAQQPQQALEMHVQQATAEAEMYRAAEGCGTSSPSGNIAGVLPVPCEEPEEAAQDVESLMRLLGM
ncbi:hypothetical protein PLESTM_001509000 [Pleodorina starrii]|nr:hypothetical protein PLESTM_001509000 [Pleodorina starrii]